MFRGDLLDGIRGRVLPRVAGSKETLGRNTRPKIPIPVGCREDSRAATSPILRVGASEQGHQWIGASPRIWTRFMEA
jgi:hypothetical protein